VRTGRCSSGLELAWLDEQIRAAMDREGTPGLAIALVRGGEVVHAEGYGLLEAQGAQPVLAGSLFGAASITKPVLASALLRAAEAGWLALDDPVERHIAPLRFEQPPGPRVTLRHLLTHTAGLPVGNAPAAPTAKTLREQVAAGAHAVEAAGRRILYANWGWDILAYVLGEVAGRPWHEHVRETLLAPLGMERSRIGVLPEARGHFRSGLDGRIYPCADPRSEVEPPTGAGSLVTSAADLARFLALHVRGGELGGRRLLQRESIAEMHRVQYATGAAAGGMGIGFRVDRWRGRLRIGHGGDGVGTTNLAAALPEEGAAFALLTNLGEGQALRSELGHAALCCLTGEPLERAPAPPGSPAGSPPEGRYRSTFWSIDVDLRGEGGAATASVAAGLVAPATPAVSRLVPLGGQRFEGAGGMFAGCELEFGVDETGRPCFYGGVYPFTFERTGDVPPPPGPPDSRLDPNGAWSGRCESPLGPVPVEIEVAGGAFRASLLTARSHAAETPHVAEGRVEGELSVSLPGLGAWRLFLRLEAHGGALLGLIHARGDSAEIRMPVRLERVR
jgi:CubicO group peptidase (beta-lactamase class C family)